MTDEAAERPLRVGVVGAGRMGCRHGRTMQRWGRQFEVVAVCDRHVAAARELAAELGVPAERVFEEVGEMLEVLTSGGGSGGRPSPRPCPTGRGHAEQGASVAGSGCDGGEGRIGLDAVVICTIHDEHAAAAIAAADRGLHVFVEKPMATSLADCEAMVAAAERTGVVLMVGQNQRYKANYRAVKRLIDSGELGPIRAIRVESNGARYGGPPMPDWIRDGRRAGGGVVMSLAAHRLDLMRWFVGEPRRVTAVCRTTRPQFTHGAEDYAFAIVEFENGAVGEVFAAYALAAAPWGESFIVYGEKGAAHAIPALVRYNEPALVASEARDARREAMGEGVGSRIDREVPSMAGPRPSTGQVEAAGDGRQAAGGNHGGGRGGEDGGQRRLGGPGRKRRPFEPLEIDGAGPCGGVNADGDSRGGCARGAGVEPVYTGVCGAEMGLVSEDMFVNELLHFAECCRTGAEPLTSGRDNLGTMRLIFAIYESARRGGPVEVGGA